MGAIFYDAQKCTSKQLKQNRLKTNKTCMVLVIADAFLGSNLTAA